MATPLKIVFMGTPEFSVPSLNAILDAGYDVIAVYTRVPKPKGRGQDVQNSPIHDVALAHNIPVYTPASLRKSPEDSAAFAALKPDVAVVAAYGLILPPTVLSAPRYGCLNVHASLLPRWRGASPVHHAILSGDDQAGVTIMQMEEGLDTGPMIVADRVAITPDMTTPMLQDILAKMGARLMVRVLDDLMLGQHLHATPQPTVGVTHAPMLTKEMGVIDWVYAARMIDCRVRALTPWPGTQISVRDNVIKILSARVSDQDTSALPGTLLSRDGHVACGDGTVLQITQVQVPTGKKMDVAAAINGGYLAVGDVFA